MKFGTGILLLIVSPIISVVLRLLGMTMHFEETGHTELSPHRKGTEKKYIYAFWHSRILMSVYFFRNRNIQVLISRHRDGEFIDRVISHYGFGSVRGSTTTGGPAALRQMAEALEKGLDVAITPDGPRGPKQTVQPGVIQLAQLSNTAIAPFSFDCSRKWVIKSWDNFIIPKPWSRGVFVWGEPVSVSRADEKVIKNLEQELNRITQIAGDYFEK